MKSHPRLARDLGSLCATMDDIITDKFKNGSFPAINAPAIAFPYLRSFLSIITMLSGYPPVMLPSVNFVEFAINAQKV